MPFGISTCAAGAATEGPGRKMSGVCPARQNVMTPRRRSMTAYVIVMKLRLSRCSEMIRFTSISS